MKTKLSELLRLKNTKQNISFKRKNRLLDSHNLLFDKKQLMLNFN